MKAFNPLCRTCPRIRHHLAKIKVQSPEYHCAPVPGFGDPQARFFILGLAPGWHGANKTGRPFTGDQSGDWLFEQLHRCGFSNLPESRSIDNGLELIECYLSNAVKCFPPDNSPSAREVGNCQKYLQFEFAQLKSPAVVLALGKVAHDAVLKAFGLTLGAAKFAHGAQHQITSDLTLIDSFHCSKYNIQTRRIDKTSFAKVFDQVVELLRE